MSEALIEKIVERISKIPASNPGVIELYPATLRDQLSSSLLRLIAKEAAAAIEEP